MDGDRSLNDSYGQLNATRCDRLNANGSTEEMFAAVLRLSWRGTKPYPISEILWKISIITPGFLV